MSDGHTMIQLVILFFMSKVDRVIEAIWEEVDRQQKLQPNTVDVGVKEAASNQMPEPSQTRRSIFFSSFDPGQNIHTGQNIHRFFFSRKALY